LKSCILHKHFFVRLFQRDNATRFLTSGFFHESVSLKHLSIPLRQFRIFSNIRGDIRGSRCTTGVVANLPPVFTTLAKLVAKFSAEVVETGGKFSAGVVDMGGKFATGVVDTGGEP
jgi:hypothetical protein